MSNMSYCRFQNTLHDFAECTRAINTEGAQDADLSIDEIRARDRLIELARDLIAKLDEDESIDFEREPSDECVECGEKAKPCDDLCFACRSEFDAALRAAANEAK